MSLLESVALWFLRLLLDYLLSKAAGQAKEQLDQIQRDKERGQINDENIKRYEQANNRAERVQAAIDLLNRTPH